MPEEPLPVTVDTRYPQSNLAACMLPWTKSFELDEEVFRRHLQQTLDGGYQNVYILGTAGEGYALSEARFRHVVTIFANHMLRDGIHQGDLLNHKWWQFRSFRLRNATLFL